MGNGRLETVRRRVPRTAEKLKEAFARTPDDFGIDEDERAEGIEVLAV
jgi:hypothetical protein